jgi:putative tricarboxylic transport membrane protein
MFDIALSALFEVLKIPNLLASLGGVIFGLFVGSVPGLTVSLGMVLILPITYGMAPVPSFSLLLGIFAAGMAGGSISAILINIPGTPSAAATALDGHAMARKGKAADAIGTAITSSFFGGLVSLFALVLISPLIARVALNFGSVELAALVFLGLALICSFGQDSIIKGLISGVLGLIIMTIGLDPMVGTPRFTFGQVSLMNGISYLPVMIGLFAIPQIVEGIVLGTEVIPHYQEKLTGVFRHITQVFKYPKIKIVSSLIGVGVGSIPGAGGPVAVFISYDYAKRLCKKDVADKLGTGIPEGVAAPEAANNAMCGGAMIPMLTLGIPGDPITAILLGALMIQGLTPGPLLFVDNPDFVYSVFWAFLVAIVMLLFVSLLTMNIWIKVLSVPKRILLPIIGVFCIVGSFSLNNSFADVWIMLSFGLIGFLMKKYKFPVVPMLLAIVLGPSFERYLRTGLAAANGDPLVFVKSPISLVFILIALFSFFKPIVTSLIKKK